VRWTVCARPSAGRPTTSTRPGCRPASAGLRRRSAACSSTSPFVEAYYSLTRLSGLSPGAPWETVDWDAEGDWPFTSAADDSPDELYALWDGTVERSRARFDAALAEGGLDQLVRIAGPDGRHASLRRLLCDLIEEYGRHTGHADLLREAVDGLVGEDPPAGWRSVSGGPPRG